MTTLLLLSNPPECMCVSTSVTVLTCTQISSHYVGIAVMHSTWVCDCTSSKPALFDETESGHGNSSHAQILSRTQAKLPMATRLS